MRVKIYRINKKVPIPHAMTGGSSGIDLAASIEEPVIINPGEYRLIPAGIVIGLPKGYEAQIRPRSGLALNSGVTVLNSPGTVDSDYRGEIGVILINHGKKPFEVKCGMRIAQLVFSRVERMEPVEVMSLEELRITERGGGGFGHTGV
ncbi:MAG: dUTP diphosphatase [Spirochaetota bacterium]